MCECSTTKHLCFELSTFGVNSKRGAVGYEVKNENKATRPLPPHSSSKRVIAECTFSSHTYTHWQLLSAEWAVILTALHSRSSDAHPRKNTEPSQTHNWETGLNKCIRTTGFPGRTNIFCWRKDRFCFHILCECFIIITLGNSVVCNGEKKNCKHM